MCLKSLVFFVFFVSYVRAEYNMTIKIRTSTNDTIFKVENPTLSWGRICRDSSYDEVSGAELNEVDIDFKHPLTITPRSRPWIPFGIEGNFNIAVKIDNSTKVVSHVGYDHGVWNGNGTLHVSQEDEELNYFCGHFRSFVIQCDKIVSQNETQVLKNKIQALQNEIQVLKNETQVSENKTQVLENETQVSKNETLVSIIESQVSKNATQVSENESRVPKNQTQVSKMQPKF